MNIEYDQQAVARDVGGYLGVEAEHLPAPSKVVVQAGTVRVEVEEEGLRAAWRATWADLKDDPKGVSRLGIQYLAEAATKLGYQDLADRLTRLKAGMAGLALVLREDGTPWSPTSVSRQASSRPVEFDRAVAGDVAAYLGVEVAK